MDSSVFMSLLREALWCSGNEHLPQGLSDAEALKVLDFAKNQAVSSLVLDALIRNKIRIPRQELFKAVALLSLLKERNEQVNLGLIELHKLLSSSGIGYLVVKGQAVASYYPNNLIRQSGDIDYYCDNKNFLLSQEVLKRVWGIQIDENNSEKHIHFTRNGIIYEGHFTLINLYGKKRNAFFQKLLYADKGVFVDIDGYQIKTLTPTFHLLYVFLHLYDHLLSLGVGLRQFCDMAVMLHYCKNDIDMVALRKQLNILDMKKAYHACCSILVNNLGLPEEELGYTLSGKDRIYGKKILDVVMYRGNMGHHNKRGGFRGWKHKLESIGIKISHFFKFAPLAPGYTLGWLQHELKRNL